MGLTENQIKRADKLLLDGGLKGVWENVRGHIEKHPDTKTLETLISVVDYALEKIKIVPDPAEESIMDFFESNDIPAPSSIQVENNSLNKSDRISMVDCPSCAELIGNDKIVCEYCGAKVNEVKSFPNPIEIKQPHVVSNNISSPVDWNKLLFSIKGRCERKLTIIAYVGYIIFSATFKWLNDYIVWNYTDESSTEEMLLYGINFIILFLLGWPVINIFIRRLHDRGRSGWFLLVALIPVVGVIWLLVEILILKGRNEGKRFGSIV